jgi:hypothetical protein
MTLCSEQTPHQQLRSLPVCILCRHGSVCGVFWVSRSRCAQLLYQSLLLENSCARVDRSGGTASCGSGYGVRCCLLRLFLATMLSERGLVICDTRFVSLRARCTPVECRGQTSLIMIQSHCNLWLDGLNITDAVWTSLLCLDSSHVTIPEPVSAPPSRVCSPALLFDIDD